VPDILHRISIDAPADRVHQLIASTEGIARWWTGRPVDGEHRVDATFRVYFGDSETPAAAMLVEAATPEHVAWRVVDGPASWIDTVITYTLTPTGAGGTTLLFRQAEWQEASEFMSGCSTNWGAYLTSLKTGAESGTFHPYPDGEISRWS
jgi:uncharacterized protein YndB with AHSA1/START domain